MGAMTATRGSSGTIAAACQPMGDEDPTGYSQRVGERLRTIRRQKHLSLQEVESASASEFKASVLGAYERGERTISVPRLQRLASFYGVPVEQLLPGDHADAVVQPVLGRPVAGRTDTLTIDLRRAQALVGPEGEMLKRYLAMIQVQRQDFNGRMLTVRTDDLHALSCLFGVASERVLARMTELALVIRS